VDPITAFSIGSTILSIGSSLFGNSAEKKRAQANAANALQAYGFNSRALGAQGVQAEEAAAQDRLLLGREGAAAESTAAASAAEGGVSGSSVTALLAQYAAETSFAQGAVDKSLENTMEEIKRRKASAFLEYQGRLASVPKPSSFATGLEIGGSLLKFAGSRQGGTR